MEKNHIFNKKTLYNGTFCSVSVYVPLSLLRSQRMLAPKKEDVSGVHTNQAMKNPRDKDHPDRPLLLSVAENVLCWEHLKPRIDEFCKLHEYDNMYYYSFSFM